MDGSRFDDLTKQLVATPTRRRLLRGALGSTLAAVLGRLGLEEAAAACVKAGRSCSSNKQCCRGATCKRRKCRCKAGLVVKRGKCVKPAAPTGCPDCGKCEACSDAGTCESTCEESCLAATLCAKAAAHTKHKKLAAFLVKEGFARDGEPEAVTYAEGGKITSRTLLTPYGTAALVYTSTGDGNSAYAVVKRDGATRVYVVGTDDKVVEVQPPVVTEEATAGVPAPSGGGGVRAMPASLLSAPAAPPAALGAAAPASLPSGVVTEALCTQVYTHEGPDSVCEVICEGVVDFVACGEGSFLRKLAKKASLAARCARVHPVYGPAACVALEIVLCDFDVLGEVGCNALCDKLDCPECGLGSKWLFCSQGRECCAGKCCAEGEVCQDDACVVPDPCANGGTCRWVGTVTNEISYDEKWTDNDGDWQRSESNDSVTMSAQPEGPVSVSSTRWDRITSTDTLYPSNKLSCGYWDAPAVAQTHTREVVMDPYSGTFDWWFYFQSFAEPTYVVEGEYRLLDWGNAGVSQPATFTNTWQYQPDGICDLDSSSRSEQGDVRAYEGPMSDLGTFGPFAGGLIPQEGRLVGSYEGTFEGAYRQKTTWDLTYVRVGN